MNARSTGFLLPVSCLVIFSPLVSAARGDVQPVKGTARAANGLSIAYDVRGKGDTALVFLHGWCSDREAWKHQLDAFAGNYRVVAIDLGGHGKSGKDREQWSVTGLAGDVEAVVKALDLKRAILVGHSMGGMVALETAKRLPGTVVAVIGVETLQNAEYKQPEEQSKQILASFEADFKGTMRAGMRGMLPENVAPELRKWITAKAEAQDPTMALSLFREFPRLDLKALFQGAKVPVRCINSGGGFQFAVPTAGDVNKKYADYQAVLMDGVGHYPMLERPAEFNQKLRVVLKEFAPKK
jgi:pimeloyl-ACP methyl ester carboxylesterase